MLKKFFHSKWTSCIENTLNTCGFSEYWISQGVPKNVVLSSMVKQRLCDRYKQTWYERVFNTAKCLNYRIFKCSHKFEEYLVDLPYDLRKAFGNYRCLGHRLPYILTFYEYLKNKCGGKIQLPPTYFPTSDVNPTKKEFCFIF